MGGNASPERAAHCADLTGRNIVEYAIPRPDDLGYYVAPLQGLRGRSNEALKKL